MATEINEIEAEKLIKRILKFRFPQYDMRDFFPSDGFFRDYYLEIFVEEVSDFTTSTGEVYEILEESLGTEGYKECYIVFSWQESWEQSPSFFRFTFEYKSYDGYVFENSKLFSVSKDVEDIIKYI